VQCGQQLDTLCDGIHAFREPVESFIRGHGCCISRFRLSQIAPQARCEFRFQFDEAAGNVSCRWKADEAGFRMPVKVGARERWQVVQPTAEWQTMKTPLKKDEFEVATDLYYVTITKL